MQINRGDVLENYKPRAFVWILALLIIQQHVPISLCSRPSMDASCSNQLVQSAKYGRLLSIFRRHLRKATTVCAPSSNERQNTWQPKLMVVLVLVIIAQIFDDGNETPLFRNFRGIEAKSIHDAITSYRYTTLSFNRHRGNPVVKRDTFLENVTIVYEIVETKTQCHLSLLPPPPRRWKNP